MFTAHTRIRISHDISCVSSNKKILVSLSNTAECTCTINKETNYFLSNKHILIVCEFATAIDTKDKDLVLHVDKISYEAVLSE